MSRAIREFMLRDKFAESLGIQLLDLGEGYSKCAMMVRDDMANAHRIAHGSAIFALADYAFATACNAHGRTALALDVKINFLQPVSIGARLVADATEESLSSRIGLYHLTVKDARGTLVAAAQATAYRKNESFLKRCKRG